LSQAGRIGWERDTEPSAESARVLMIEEDGHLAGLLSTLLRGAFPRSLLIIHATHVGDAVQELLDRGATSVVLGNPGPGENLLGAIDQLRAASQEAPIVVVSESDEPHVGAQAIAAGAQDFLAVRELTVDALTRAMRFGLLRKRAESQLTHRALHDPLTSLPNRALFLDRLGMAIDRSRRLGTTVAVLFMDIDNFKLINDSFGHATGDQMLCVLGDRLRGMLRPADTIARFGGDEFALLFEDLGGQHDVTLMAERIGRAARVPVRLDDSEASITVSIGIAVVDDPSVDADTVMHEADTAMYRAKERGRARYELVDEA
jgi:diguanylate cyclase (GGDEF)-like protein